MERADIHWIEAQGHTGERGETLEKDGCAREQDDREADLHAEQDAASPPVGDRWSRPSAVPERCRPIQPARQRQRQQGKEDRCKRGRRQRVGADAHIERNLRTPSEEVGRQCRH